MPREEGSLLIASVSGRSLAQAARRAGLTPLVADFFSDADTEMAAHACRKLPGIARGFRWRSLYPALKALADAAPSPILGFVYGSGFEDRTALLGLIAKHWPVLGTDPATVARLKAPEDFFAMLDRLGIAHPPTSSVSPARGGAWLAKKRGGAGGGHIVPRRLAKAAANLYYQERVAGRAVSALFVANGRDARVIGFSEQWTAPRPSSPWRYGGAVSPARLSASVTRRATAAVTTVARAFDIKGLASADFLVRDGEALLLEINPRPGATLDIFDRGATPLLRLHLQAVRQGMLPSRVSKSRDALAAAIVYAERGGRAPAGIAWPAWVADRPKPSEWIDKNRPICTVLARARTAAGAKRSVEARRRFVLKLFQSVRTRVPRERHEKTGRVTQGSSLAERQRQGGAARERAHR